VEERLGALGVAELRELRQLRDENRKVKGLVADLTLDKTILHEALRKNGKACRPPGARALGSGGVPVHSTYSSDRLTTPAHSSALRGEAPGFEDCNHVGWQDWFHCFSPLAR
jgi:hypothetical protein